MDRAHVEVDELFGDGGTTGDTIPLSLPLEGTATEGIASLIDDLHRTSSEQKKVAWSPSGCLAAIGSDLQSVSMRYLVLSGSSEKWHLSKGHIVDLSVNGHAQHPLLQLAWSPSGQDIALTDRAGRLTIVKICTMALNETTVLRPATLDREDELNQVLALQWLNIDRRKSSAYTHATKGEAGWSYVASPRQPIGPFWPCAVIAVTSRGAIVLHYQRRTDFRWTTARAELRSVSTSDYFLTHAAIGRIQGNKLLIVVQNYGRQIFVYLATLDVPDLRDERQVATGIKISVENISACLPHQGERNLDKDDNHIAFETTSNFLSHLEVIPISDIEKAEQPPPTILAFFTPSLNAMGVVDEGRPGATVVKRWHVVSTELKLHPTFDSMQPGGNGNLAGPGTASSLRRLDDVHINRIVTSVQRIDPAEQVALGAADGSLILHDSTSLTPSYAPSGSSRIDSLSQSGFVFPSIPGGSDPSISPNMCVSASLNSDGKVQLTHVEQASGLTFDGSDLSMVDSAIAALMLSFSRSVYPQTSANDIIFLLTKYLGPHHYQKVMQSMFKDLIPDGDFSPTQDCTVLTAKPMIARVLSLAASWGRDWTSGQPTCATMLSWLSLHIRSCTATVLRIYNSVGQNRGLDWKDPDACDIACNNIKWILDLFKFIVDELFEMDDRDESDSGLAPITHPVTDAERITQLLLISLWPRLWLGVIPRILRGIVRVIQDPKPTLAPEAVPAFSRITEIIETSSLKIEPLEQLFLGADKVIQQLYHGSGMSVPDRADTERSILCRGEIPEVLRSAVPTILREVLPTPRAKMDRLSLYLNDHSWLGIRDDGKTKTFNRDYVVDVHRKIVLRKKTLGRVRRCVRCGSISTDLVRVKYRPQYLQLLMSRCVCEDGFEVIGPGEI